MIYSFPTNEKLWAKYAEIRADALRESKGLGPATEFYGQHRTAMDEGPIVAWPERFHHDELSAVPHAVNLKLQDEAALFAKYQNEPLPETAALDEELTADDIAAKVNGRRRGEVSLGCDHLTMVIDVQQERCSSLPSLRRCKALSWPGQMSPRPPDASESVLALVNRIASRKSSTS